MADALDIKTLKKCQTPLQNIFSSHGPTDVEAQPRAQEGRTLLVDIQVTFFGVALSSLKSELRSLKG